MTTFTQEITARNDQQLSLEDAIALVHSNAKQEWKDEADQVVRSLCQTRQFFTADDVLERMMTTTTDNRALGQVMKDAAKNGLCRKTDRVQATRIAKRHGRLISIWESLPSKA